MYKLRNGQLVTNYLNGLVPGHTAKVLRFFLKRHVVTSDKQMSKYMTCSHCGQCYEDVYFQMNDDSIL